MNATKLHERDRQIGTHRFGDHNSAFIAPKLPKARTKTEKITREIFGNAISNTVTVHIYDVLEMMEKSYLRGKSDYEKTKHKTS